MNVRITTQDTHKAAETNMGIISFVHASMGFMLRYVHIYI